MNKNGGHYFAKQNKSSRERKILYNVIDMWNVIREILLHRNSRIVIGRSLEDGQME